MAGYIGKISAVVTANTSDLQRKMAGAADATTKFADTLNRSLNKSSQDAKASINKIFTPLQQLERKLAAARSANIRFGPDKGVTDAQADSLRALTQTVEQLNRPLEEAAKKFTSLGLGVQASFAPALQRVQSSVVAVNEAVQQTGRISVSSFRAAEAQIQSTARAIQRLTQAQQLASQTLTGRELQFSSPSLFNTLSRSGSLSAKAAALPRKALADGSIAQRVQQLKQFEDAALKAQATVESLQLNPQASPSVIDAAKRRLDNLIETARRAQDELELAIAEGSSGPARDILAGARDRNRRRIASLTGDVNIDSGSSLSQAGRDIESLASRVGSVRQQLETLPNAIRVKFIPELQKAQQQLAALQNSPAATAKQIENAARRVERLEQSARRAAAAFDFRSSFGGSGLRGIEEGLNEQALRGYTAQLQILQQTLANTSQSARGPAVVAFDSVRTAIAKAMENGTLETARTRKEIQLLIQDAVRAAAAARGINPGTLARRVQGAGDVARGSFGNTSLAIQQAAFALDDFFSVTGGLDQRIRAAGNNISQLGFIVGGTTGLIAGIAASITSQLVVALVKWANAGTETQDRLKSLNETLERQKSLVEGLAEAYRSVARSIGDAGFSGESRQARDRQQTLEDLVRRQDEQLRERISALDPAVQRERGIQAARRRELEATDDAGERVRLEREIRASQARERTAADAAFNRPGITAEQVVASVADSIFRADVARIEDEARRAAAAAGPGGGGQATAEEQRRRGIAEAERRRAEFLEREGRRIGGAVGPREQTEVASRIIEEAQERIASQITTGIAGFFDGANEGRRRELARLEEERGQLEKEIFRSATNRVAIEATDIALRAAADIGAAIQIVDDVFAGRSSQLRASLESITRTIEGAQARLAEAQAAGSVEEAEAIRDQIRAADQQKDALVSAANSTRLFASALDKAAGDLARTIAGESSSFAEQARREANAARANPLAAQGGFFEDEIRAAARREEIVRDEAAGFAERARQIEADRLAAVQAFERDAGALGGPIGDLVRERDALAEEASGENVPAARRQEIEARRSQIEAELGELFENTAPARALRQAADELDVAATRRRRVFESAARGEQLLRSPSEQAAVELSQALFDIQKAAQVRRGAGIPLDPEKLAEAEQRVREDAFRSVAPAVFALRDASENAVLQGPSRARLNASDITTQAGTDELNRLLRGDDSAREQNLVELRKQTKELEGLRQDLQGIGVAD